MRWGEENANPAKALALVRVDCIRDGAFKS